MSEDTPTDPETCFACDEPIHDGDWVIPLQTYRATYRGDGDDVALDTSEMCETLIHAECLNCIDTEPRIHSVIESAFNHDHSEVGGGS